MSDLCFLGIGGFLLNLWSLESPSAGRLRAPPDEFAWKGPRGNANYTTEGGEIQRDPGRPARPHEETTPDQYSHVERPARGRRSAQLQLRWIEGGLGELHLHRLQGLEHDLRDGE